MSFPFNALIDGVITRKVAVKKVAQGGGRPESILVDADGVSYEASADDALLFVPTSTEPVERFEQAEAPSHEPETVGLNSTYPGDASGVKVEVSEGNPDGLAVDPEVDDLSDPDSE